MAVVTLAACGVPVLDGAGRYPSGLEALALLLPILQRNHREGVVVGISSHDEEPRNAQFAVWGVGIWVPEDTSHLIYRVVHGAPRERPAGSLTRAVGDPLPPPPALMRLHGEPVPRLVDSDRAVATAEEAGGRDFRRRTGAHVQSAALRPGEDGRPSWHVFYSRFYTMNQATFEIDGNSGEVTGVEGGVVSPTPTPR